MEKKQRPPVYYSDYLQLDKLLHAQFPESEKENLRADDEMLFIIIHQAYELWFKLILHEIDLVRRSFSPPAIDNNAPDLYHSVHRLKRICRILDIAVMQMSVMETMTPLDFLDFRDLLRPASGFQSIQFKMIEAKLGLAFDQRYGKGYYLSQLRAEDVERVKKAEEETSLFVLIGRWLERMPFARDARYWPQGNQGFWDQYRQRYAQTLVEGEEGNLDRFDLIFGPEKVAGRRLSPEACRHALFIMVYRDLPLLHMPYELLSTLLEIDELMGMWRYRHIHMVQRTIGRRVGTGGSTGADYLQKAADSHYVFREIAELTSYLLPRHQVPPLPENLKSALGYQPG